jgi:hypothetical protein
MLIKAQPAGRNNAIAAAAAVTLQLGTSQMHITHCLHGKICTPATITPSHPGQQHRASNQNHVLQGNTLCT